MKKLLIIAVLFFMVSFAHAQSAIVYFTNSSGLPDYDFNISIWDNTTNSFVGYSSGFIYSAELTDGDEYIIETHYFPDPYSHYLTLNLYDSGHSQVASASDWDYPLIVHEIHDGYTFVVQ